MVKKLVAVGIVITCALVWAESAKYSKQALQKNVNESSVEQEITRIHSDYPEDKPELLERRTPYSRTFDNGDGTYTVVLTRRPTSYSVVENGEVRWVDIPFEMPVMESVTDKYLTTNDADQMLLDNTYYGDATEKNNDAIDPYYFCRTGGKCCVVGAGRDPTWYGFHLYQRMFTEFVTTSIPPGSQIAGVAYTTYITSYDPNVYDLTETSWDEEYDWYEIWPWIRSMNLRPANYGPQYDWVSNNNGEALYDDCWDGALLYDGGGYYWDQGMGAVTASFNSTGVADFQSKYENGWYAFAVVDKAENNENPDYWEGVVFISETDKLYVLIPGIEEEQANTVLPAGFALRQNSPNPVSSRTTIAYSLANAGDVELTIFDVSGAAIATLVDGSQEAGMHEVVWNIGHISEARLPSGVYFYRLRAADYTETKKMIVCR